MSNTSTSSASYSIKVANSILDHFKSKNYSYDFDPEKGIITAIVTSDDQWKYWDVWKTGMTRKHVVSARSADEALVVARGITHDYNLDTVQCH